MNNTFKNTWNEAIVAWFNVLCLNLPGGTEEKHEIRSQDIHPLGRDWNMVPPEYEARVRIKAEEMKLFRLLSGYALYDRKHDEERGLKAKWAFTNCPQFQKNVKTMTFHEWCWEFPLLYAAWNLLAWAEEVWIKLGILIVSWSYDFEYGKCLPCFALKDTTGFEL
jgi:hypothetical protein